MEPDDPGCSFSVKVLEKGLKAVCWKGRTAYLSDLLESYERIAREDLFGKLPGNQNAFLVILDVVGELLESQKFQASNYRLAPRAPHQKLLQEWLLGYFGKSLLRIPLLEPLVGKGYAYMRGLIMLNCGHTEWTRLGV